MPRPEGAPCLVSAGEPSGDRIAASCATALLARGHAPFGMAGAAGERAGVERVARLGDVAAMGALPVVARAWSIAAAFRALLLEAARRRTRHALLVDYQAFHRLLGERLRARGVRVGFVVAPQVWAWRASRLGTFPRAVDRLSVVLPFEEALWRGAGVAARYVGHPALDAPAVSRADARRVLGIAPRAPAVALLPGSRAHEVRAMLPRLLAAAREVRAPAWVLLSGALDHATSAWARRASERAGARVIDAEPHAGAAPFLAAFDAALATSGTVVLECALAAVPTAMTYRASPLAAAVARRLLTTPHLALPNVLLGERRVPELVQDDACPASLARALSALLEADPRRAAGTAAELRARLAVPDDGATVGERAVAWTLDGATP